MIPDLAMNCARCGGRQHRAVLDVTTYADGAAGNIRLILGMWEACEACGSTDEPIPREPITWLERMPDDDPRRYKLT